MPRKIWLFGLIFSVITLAFFAACRNNTICLPLNFGGAPNGGGSLQSEDNLIPVPGAAGMIAVPSGSKVEKNEKSAIIYQDAVYKQKRNVST